MSSLDTLNSVGSGLEAVLALDITVAGLAVVKITSCWFGLWMDRALLRLSLYKRKIEIKSEEMYESGSPWMSFVVFFMDF